MHQNIMNDVETALNRICVSYSILNKGELSEIIMNNPSFQNGFLQYTIQIIGASGKRLIARTTALVAQDLGINF